MTFDEIPNLEAARTHFDKLIQLLKDNRSQTETRNGIEVIEREKVVFFNTLVGTSVIGKILRRRASIQAKRAVPSVTGFEALFCNVGNQVIENGRVSNIYTEQAVFMIYSNFDYTILYGVLESKRTLEDLRKSGFLEKDEQREKINLGWKIVIV